jgi:hypothetical protein
VPQPCATSSKASASTPSPTPGLCPMPRCARGSIALPPRARQAAAPAHAPGDRRTSRARGHSPSSAASSKPRFRTAPSMPTGVAAHWPRGSLVRRGSSWAGNESAGGEQHRAARLSPHRSPGARPGRPGVGLDRPRCPGGPGPPRRAPGALCRRNPPLALGAAAGGLVAHHAARPPPHAPAAPEAEQPRGSPHTPRVATLSCLGPDHQRRVAQGDGGGPVWHLPGRRYTRPAR